MFKLCLAYSDDGVTWVKSGSNPVGAHPTSLFPVQLLTDGADWTVLWYTTSGINYPAGVHRGALTALANDAAASGFYAQADRLADYAFDDGAVDAEITELSPAVGNVGALTYEDSEYRGASGKSMGKQGDAGNTYYRNAASDDTGQVLDTWFKCTDDLTLTTQGRWGGFLCMTDGAAAPNGYLGYCAKTTVARQFSIAIYRVTNGAYTDLTPAPKVVVTLTPDTWYRYRFERSGTSLTMTIYDTDGTTVLGTDTETDGTYSTGRTGLRVYDPNIYFDDYRYLGYPAWDDDRASVTRYIQPAEDAAVLLYGGDFAVAGAYEMWPHLAAGAAVQGEYVPPIAARRSTASLIAAGAV